jgi:hypothetical protein
MLDFAGSGVSTGNGSGTTAPRGVTALAASAAFAARSIVGLRAVEEPAWSVVERVGPVEIREYAASIVAETIVSGDELDARAIGFRRLSAYISGQNETRSTIGMTAPVAQSRTRPGVAAPASAWRDTAEKWTIRFFMPRDSRIATLPAPRDPVIRLISVPHRIMAVLRFSGSTEPEAVAAKREALQTRLAAGRWQAESIAAAWFYDPPWTLPFRRRNEIAVSVIPRY